MAMVLGIDRLQRLELNNSGLFISKQLINYRMYKLIFLITCLIFSNTYSQNKQFKVLDKKDKNPLNDVLFYSNDKVIAKSNKYGVIKLDNKNYGNLFIVKEDYYDTIINLELLQSDEIYLKKIDVIELKEVIVRKKNIESILDSVYSNSITLKKINPPKYLHFFNVLTTQNDTLLFANNRVTFIKGRGCFIERENKIISNFTQKNSNPVFSLSNHNIIFNKNFTHSNSPINSFELMIVTKLKDKFLFSIFEEEDFYQIKFEPKVTNNEYPYSGYIIVDKSDFGVYEFKAEVSIKKNKRNLVLENKILNFQILTETSYIKYKKDINGNYELIKYAYDSELKVLNGFFKDRIFINKCRKELTPYFDTSSMVPFDVITYKTK